MNLFKDKRKKILLSWGIPRFRANSGSASVTPASASVPPDATAESDPYATLGVIKPRVEALLSTNLVISSVPPLHEQRSLVPAYRSTHSTIRET